MAHGYVAEWADLIGRQEEWYPHYNSQQLAAMGACKACSMRSMQHAAFMQLVEFKGAQGQEVTESSLISRAN